MLGELIFLAISTFLFMIGLVEGALNLAHKVFLAALGWFIIFLMSVIFLFIGTIVAGPAISGGFFLGAGIPLALIGLIAFVYSALTRDTENAITAFIVLSVAIPLILVGLGLAGWLFITHLLGM